MAGCTLEDCLKQFFVAEYVENYCCSNCWHTAAIEYSSDFTEDKIDIEKLRSCNKNDSCECKNLSSLEAFTWSNKFCRTLKQSSISRCPKILCIHLQRASYSLCGQSVKLKGHIAFPSILDMSPYLNAGVGIKTVGPNSQFGLLNRNSREVRSFGFPKYQNMLLDPQKLSSKATSARSTSSKTRVQERNTITVENGPCLEASQYSFLDSERRAADSNRHVIFHPPTPSRRHMYRLVSVVVHFGTSGDGHYTVYRKVTARLGHQDPVALLESSIEQWFCVSDSEVHSVSEKDVLDANASVLFYEKIDDS